MKKSTHKLIGFSFFSLVATSLFAKVPSASEVALSWTYNHIIFILGGLVVIGTLISLGSLMTNLLQAQKRIYMAAEMEAEELANASKPSWFKRMYGKAWSLVPIDKEQDIELSHSFDGIRELDNKLPPWWVYMFYLTIVWAIGYIYVTHFREGRVSQEQEYYAEMEVAEEEKWEYLQKQANSIDESNIVALTDDASIEFGKKVYMVNCVTCHGASGEGGVGPNMTDKYWIHGGSTVDIFKTIKYGVPEKGMIAWNAQLPPSSIQKLTSFIKTLEGTNPPNPKEAQGLLYEENITENPEVNE